MLKKYSKQFQCRGRNFPAKLAYLVMALFRKPDYLLNEQQQPGMIPISVALK
jgi:hypothetical protein